MSAMPKLLPGGRMAACNEPLSACAHGSLSALRCIKTAKENPQKIILKDVVHAATHNPFKRPTQTQAQKKEVRYTPLTLYRCRVASNAKSCQKI